MSEHNNLLSGSNPAIDKASAFARQTFKYFWRELYWERRRIIPALDLSVIKLAFSDGPRNDGNPEVEHMWVDEVTFDGEKVGGLLISSPHWTKSVAQGDFVSAPLSELGDWMFAIKGVAYGAYTVNVIRSQMPPNERQDHDEAWGLDFGSPETVRLVYKEAPAQPGEPRTFRDHPACLSMLAQIDEQMRKDPSFVNEQDKDGWITLHHEALAGNMGIIQLLLKHGCDVNKKTPDGRRASDLACAIGWTAIETLLRTA